MGRRCWFEHLPEEGEAGAFMRGRLVEKLSGRLKLRTRPMIAELERYAKTWEKNLEELFGIRIQYAFDWDGFTCNDDEGKNALALTRLRENGIEWMQRGRRWRRRIRISRSRCRCGCGWIYLEFMPRAEMKGIRGSRRRWRYSCSCMRGMRGI